jgi:hypothetical protein
MVFTSIFKPLDFLDDFNVPYVISLSTAVSVMSTSSKTFVAGLSLICGTSSFPFRYVQNFLDFIASACDFHHVLNNCGNLDVHDVPNVFGI